MSRRNHFGDAMQDASADTNDERSHLSSEPKGPPKKNHKPPTHRRTRGPSANNGGARGRGCYGRR